MEQEIWKSLIFWGPGMVLAIIILYGLFKLANTVGLKFIATLKDQACSMAAQATSMENLSKSIEIFCQRDNSEHREMIILLKVIANRLNYIEEKKDGGT